MSASPALEFYSADAAAFQLLAVEPDLAAWSSFPPSSEMLVFAARSDNQPLAIALLRPIIDEIELIALAIAPAQRRHGVGRRFFGMLRSELARCGFCNCHAEVAADNHAARAFYHQLGFVEVGRSVGYYRRGAGRMDAMRLILPIAADETIV